MPDHKLCSIEHKKELQSPHKFFWKINPSEWYGRSLKTLKRRNNLFKDEPPYETTKYIMQREII